jgi:hypothetical protein
LPLPAKVSRAAAIRMALHFVHKRRDFREVEAGADDIQDFQALAQVTFVLGFEIQYSIQEMCFRRGLSAFRAKKVPLRWREVRFPGKTP